MRECAFTIVAKNYIGLAKILGQSLHQHNPETDFRIYVVDEFAERPAMLPSEVIIARDVLNGLSEEQWTDMAFKYDLTEFCTAIKPFCFEHIFADGYEKAHYVPRWNASSSLTKWSRFPNMSPLPSTSLTS